MEIIRETNSEWVLRALRSKSRPISYILTDEQALDEIVTRTQHETGDGSTDALVVKITPGTGVIELANQILEEGSRSTGACIVTMDIKTWPSRDFADSLYMGAGIMFRTVLLGLTGGTEEDMPVIEQIADGMWPAMQPEMRGSRFLPAALLVVLDGAKVEIEK